MKTKETTEYNGVIWTKLSIYIFIVLLSLVLFFLAPKKVFKEDTPYRVATSMAIISDENYIFHDYKVYSTNERFEVGLINDVEEVKDSFKTRNEIVAVKIYGDSLKTEIKDDYLIIYSPDVPDLNIEYYIVGNMNLDDVSIPCRTFIILFTDIITLVNNIYLSIILVVIILILSIFIIKIISTTYILKNRYSKKA